jgi:hypothetical protein
MLATEMLYFLYVTHLFASAALKARIIQSWHDKQFTRIHESGYHEPILFHGPLGKLNLQLLQTPLIYNLKTPYIHIITSIAKDHLHTHKARNSW